MHLMGNDAVWFLGVLGALSIFSGCCKVLRENAEKQSALDFTSTLCSPPLLVLNGSETVKGEFRIRSQFSQVKEVKFSGSIGPLGEKRLCKIKCIGGKWVGPLCVGQQGILLIFGVELTD